MGSIVVRAARHDDVDWVARHDGHLGSGTLAAKVAAGEVLVAEMDGSLTGLLRFDWMWSTVPFVAQVRVLDQYRRRGVGRALVDALAAHARDHGARFLLSSATGDEHEPQAWHRAIGFAECGQLRGINEDGASEVIFRLALQGQLAARPRAAHTTAVPMPGASG